MNQRASFENDNREVCRPLIELTKRGTKLDMNRETEQNTPRNSEKKP